MLSEQDKAALGTFEQKLMLLRDYVTGVAVRTNPGLYLYGPGGIGKSYSVLGHLREIGEPYRLYNSRMTGKGLFTALRDAPEVVHVLEDMERLTKDPDAQGVLRSALWAQPGHDRRVTWTTATEGKVAFAFRGGLILISNAPLANLPELKALATRIGVYKLVASDAELTAKMRELAVLGFSDGATQLLDPEACAEVTEHLLAECSVSGCPLDLRLQQKAFQTYRQHAADHTCLHWKDLIAASVRETACHFRHEPDAASPEEKKSRKRNVLRAIMAECPPDKWQGEYLERTKAKRADYFRRKQEVERGEFDQADAR